MRLKCIFNLIKALLSLINVDLLDLKKEMIYWSVFYEIKMRCCSVINVIKMRYYSVYSETKMYFPLNQSFFYQ